MSQRDAERLLHGLEYGGLPSADGAILAEDIDPVLLHAIVSYVREAYPASDPAAQGVLQRLVELTSRSAKVIGRAKEGESDPITGWFRSEYSFREFRGRGNEMIAMLVDKLES